MILVVLMLLSLLIALVLKDSSTNGIRATYRAANAAAAIDRTVGADIPSGSLLYSGTLQELTGGLSGSKRALLFGLNYTGTENQLQGCIQDTVNISSYLRSKGFSITTFTDRTSVKPTKKNMTTKMNEFLSSLRPNDVGFIWYSGHGTLVNNNKNAWVPLDFRSSGFLSEDSFRNKIVALDPSVKLFVGSDSCYSGSFFDLKYDVESGTAPQRSLLERRNTSYSIPKTKNIRRVIPSTDNIVPLDSNIVDKAVREEYRLYDIQTSASRSTVIHISGCRDNQTSADAFITGSSQGAMSWSFLTALKTPNISLGQLESLMRSALIGYTQVPQLSFGLALNPNTKLSAIGLQ